MAKNRMNETKISIQQKELSLEQDIIMTVNDFNIQQNLIKSAEEALEIASLAYETTKQRFIIGKADLSMLNLTLNNKNSAQQSYIGALRDYWLSYYKLRRLTLYDFIEGASLSMQLEKSYGFWD